ncbi:AAA family ATPase [Cryptosporangium aurantiacum]|uniref:Nuclease SbcCD subunit C n=1 Tax=Cryptosporangium aurantiacum TaxID=134849 RepID=A0A1M7R6L8_9ACTN|nr:SMC family ATPase [Cryptosporangium aurantiacum]SHN41934.1 exonuclease SbcC [Cryptosporangium aurantiacum]
MRPVLLDMAGFGSFREPTTVDFAEADYFALVGPTGAGKSTVIDAITFALFGSVPRWDDKRKVALALAPTATRGTVRLLFDVGPERYVVVRELRRAASGSVTVKNVRLERLADPAALGDLEDDTDLVAADKEVTPAVERLLGLTFEHFCTCVVLPQGDFAEFLHARAGDRQKILVKLLGLEVYDQIARAANTEAARERQNAELLAEQLGRYDDATDDALAAAEARVAALVDAEAQVATALPELAAAAQQARTARETVARLSAERERLAAVEVPASLGELDAALRSARGVAAKVGEALADAETADSAARAAVAAAPERGPLEHARRARAELDALVEGRPALVERQAEAAEALSNAEARVVAAEQVVEQARTAQLEAVSAADAAGSAVVRLRAERARLESVTVPAAVGELDSRLRSAREAAARAGSVLAEAEAADSAARAAVAAAPPRGPVESARRARVELDAVAGGRPALVERRTAAAAALDDAERDVRRAQDALEQARSERDAEARTRTAAVLRPHLVAGEPCPVCAQSVATLPPPLDDQHGAADADRRVTEAQRAADAAVAGRSASTDVLRSAEAALATADEAIDRLQTVLADPALHETVRRGPAASRGKRPPTRRSRAAAPAADGDLAEARDGGDRAPAAAAAGNSGDLLGLEEIDRWLTARDALDAAARAADAALMAARAARADADRDAAKVDAEASGVRSALREARDALAPLGAPAGLVEDVAAGWAALAGWAASAAEERRSQLTDAEKSAEAADERQAEAEHALTVAGERLTAARRAHTEAARAEQRAAAELAAADRTAQTLTAQLGDAPDAAALAATLAELDALERAARDADQQLRAARNALTAAQRAEKAAYEEVATTVRGLTAVREPLVSLGAPAIPSDDPVGGWRAFAEWAVAAAATRTEQLAAADEAVHAADRLLAGREHDLAESLDALAVPVPPDRPLAETAAPALATTLAEARAAERRLAERRREAAELAERRKAADEAQHVARQLGQLLRSDAFPRWLVASALDLLVAEASATLNELSGGQFALTHEAGEFVIVDHADADSRRPVKTLSGGETFQASLALALALSAHLSTMAASGAARLDAIFLDEGFGTLDEATLEVVAATLENLAAGGDRMVGLVTHVAALAERVPVRFEVSRDQRTSVVTKVMQ